MPVVSIVGGGLVGSLAAVYMGNRGYEVHVYESRPGQHHLFSVLYFHTNFFLCFWQIFALTKTMKEEALTWPYPEEELPLLRRLAGTSRSLRKPVFPWRAVSSTPSREISLLFLMAFMERSCLSPFHFPFYYYYYYLN
jgi:hypothetical protein